MNFMNSSLVFFGAGKSKICAGCTVALETLATLLAEPGDVFLIPAPYYSSFVDDINERAGVLALGVPCDETLSRDAFEQAYERVTGEGKKSACRIILVTEQSHRNCL